LVAACQEVQQHHEAPEQVVLDVVSDSGGLTPCPVLSGGRILETADLAEGAYPCRIVAVHTGVSIVASSDARHPDPLVHGPTAVARNSRGIVYTPAAGPSSVLAWNTDGTFLAVVAKHGDGPGEISGRVTSLFVDDGDSLHVQESAGRWIVFDPAHRFVRQFEGPRRAQLAHHLDASRVLHTGPVAGAPTGFVFHVTDLDGTYLSSHGTPRPGRASDAEAQRPSAIGADHSVWIAPRAGTEGFVVERRDLSGGLVQLLRRRVSWLPLEGYSDLPLAPDFRILHSDQHGLLWVGVGVKDLHWQPPRPGTPQLPAADQSDFRLEVIDPGRGRVLASVRFDHLDARALPPIYPVARWSRDTWGTSTDSLGFGSIHLYKLYLAGNTVTNVR
jgi:hypothetical protein